MAAGKLREAAARGNLQEVLRLIEDGAKIQPDEVSFRNAMFVQNTQNLFLSTFYIILYMLIE